MPINVWKTSAIQSTGNSLIFGTVDFNRISDLLNGKPDVGDTEIDSNFTLLQNRFKLRDAANLHDITISAPATLADNFNLILPPLTADDAVVAANAAVEIANKTINLSNNIIKDTGAAVGDILRFDGTSYKKLPKGAPSTVLQIMDDGSDVFWGPGGTGIWSASFAESLSNKTVGIDTNTIKESISTNNTSGAILINNGTKYITRARGSLGTVLQSGASDLLYSLIGDNNISPHTTTKISITDKSLLHPALIYSDQSNDFGANFQDIGQIAIPSAPASGSRRLFADSTNNGALSIISDAGIVTSLESVAASAWSASAAEILLNKTIDPVNNTLPNVRTFAGVKKSGHWYAIGGETGSDLFHNFLQQPFGTTVRNRSSIGTWQTYTTGTTSGFSCATRTLDTFTCRKNNPTFATKLSLVSTIANLRVFAGFTSDVSQDPKNTTCLDSKHGVLFCYGDGIGDGNGSTGHWYVMVNNGSSSSYLQPTGISAATGDRNVFQLKFNDTLGKISYSINGSAWADITTQVPASTTLLGVAWGVQTTTGSSRSLEAWYVDVTSTEV